MMRTAHPPAPDAVILASRFFATRDHSRIRLLGSLPREVGRKIESAFIGVHRWFILLRCALRALCGESDDSLAAPGRRGLQLAHAGG
jgi:hypothetical protein